MFSLARNKAPRSAPIQISMSSEKRRKSSSSSSGPFPTIPIDSILIPFHAVYDGFNRFCPILFVEDGTSGDQNVSSLIRTPFCRFTVYSAVHFNLEGQVQLFTPLGNLPNFRQRLLNK